MAIVGRTYKPIVNYEKCQTCSLCLQACPSEILVEIRREDNSLRGRIYSEGDNKIRIAEGTKFPPCQLACPIHQDVRGYVKLIAEGRYRDAVLLLRETSPLPSVCGYVCHHPCEAKCNRTKVDDALSIKALKRFLTELDDAYLNPPIPKTVTNQKVSIIGSGPAGLAAAYELAIKGYEVEAIESYMRPGGMLAWAIPEFRLPKDILDRDIKYIQKMGVNFRTGIQFGSDMVLSDLMKNGSKAVILATGTQKSLRLNIENEGDVEGYYDCLMFLKKYVSGEKIHIGPHVLIVGGGNAAIDVARLVRRLPAPKCKPEITMLVLEARDKMPAFEDEIHEALEEGIIIRNSVVPKRMITSDGKVKGLVCMNTEPQEAPDTKRRPPVIIKGSEFLINGDIVISAIGQESDYTAIAKGLLFKGLPKSSLEADDNNMLVNRDAVFVAGDFVNGPTTVVDAMASGKKVALAVNTYLNG